MDRFKFKTPLRKALLTGAAIILAVSVAGCASDRRMTTGSIDRGSSRPIEHMSQQEIAGSLEGLGRAYASDSGNKAVAMRYASALQATGRTDQSLAVMRKAAIDFPRDREVLAAYGKALAASGEFEPALDAVRRAQTPEYPDWRLMSAEAAILDQLGQASEARGLYQRALDMQPDEPSILSNFAMSYVLEGNLSTAETYLKRASSAPAADSRVRQNLALVVGLQGRFDEAKQIASHELSPEQAKANMDYLRAMLAQQNAWNELEGE